jgi:hypothetical protein
MKNYSIILTGAAGLAAVLAIATPAAAQSYPYGNSNNGIVGAIINSVTGGGYGQYPMGNYGYGQVNERTAVSMCAAATEQRLNGNYRGQPGYGYNNGYANNGYQSGYGYNYNGQGARVIGITNVERRNGGSLKVSGVANSGRTYGGQGGYNNGYYGQGAYVSQAADLRFNCKVNTRGQVTDVNISRNREAYRGF